MKSKPPIEFTEKVQEGRADSLRSYAMHCLFELAVSENKILSSVSALNRRETEAPKQYGEKFALLIEFKGSDESTLKQQWEKEKMESIDCIQSTENKIKRCSEMIEKITRWNVDAEQLEFKHFIWLQLSASIGELNLLIESKRKMLSQSFFEWKESTLSDLESIVSKYRSEVELNEKKRKEFNEWIARLELTLGPEIDQQDEDTKDDSTDDLFS